MGHYNAKRKRFDYYVVVCRDIGQVVTHRLVGKEDNHENNETMSIDELLPLLDGGVPP